MPLLLTSHFLELLFGTTDLSLYIVQWVFAAIGAFLSLSMQANKRDVLTPSTPVHFSWHWLWCDNTRRLTATAGLIFIFLRFPTFFIHPDITSATGTGGLILYAFGVGFTNDKLAQYLKKVNFLGMAETGTRKSLPDAPLSPVDPNKPAA